MIMVTGKNEDMLGLINYRNMKTQRVLILAIDGVSGQIHAPVALTPG
jgi:hypothetical protein